MSKKLRIYFFVGLISFLESVVSFDPLHFNRGVTCGYNTTITNQWQTIATPNWQENYPNDANCQWNFALPNNTAIEILIENGETEQCCDFVDIFHYNETSDTQSHLRRLRGEIRSESYLLGPLVGNLVILFRSDNSVTRGGFQARIRSRPGNPEEQNTTSSTPTVAPSQPSTTEASGLKSCGFSTDLTRNWQNISTPNWPNAYPNRASCEWKFFVSEPTAIQILLHEGRTESCCDFVEINYVNETFGNRTFLGRRAGYVRSEDIYLWSEAGYLIVSFKSDHTVVYNGYYGSLRKIAAMPTTAQPATAQSRTAQPTTTQSTTAQPTTTQSTTAQPTTTQSTTQQPTTTSTSICGFNTTLTSTWQNISSPNWPNSYTHLERCQWKLHIPSSTPIEILIHDGRIEQCCDYFRIDHVNERFENRTTQLRRTGYITSERVFLASQAGYLVIDFVSDRSVSFRGIYISMRTIPVIPERPANTTMARTTIAATTTTDATTLPVTTSTPVCGIISNLTSNWQNISTPNWPNEYPNWAMCEWKFFASEPTAIQILINEGRTESCCDFVELYYVNERFGNRTSLGRRSGYIKFEDISLTMEAGYLQIIFVSDGSVTEQGYSGSIRKTTGHYLQNATATTPTASSRNRSFKSVVQRIPVVECAVGVEMQSSFYQISQRRNVICPSGPSGQPGCMQMDVDGAVMGFQMKFGYGMCVDDVSFCPTFDCRTMFDGVLANLSIPVRLDINKCDLSCVANQSSEGNISTSTPSTPVTTEYYDYYSGLYSGDYENYTSGAGSGDSTFLRENMTTSGNSGNYDYFTPSIHRSTVVECAVGVEIQSSLYQTSQRRNVICPSGSSAQPGCMQMNVDGAYMGFQMKFGYGMCVNDVSFCPTFDCRTMFDGVLANLSIPMNFDINKCDVSCLANQRSEGNISTPTHSTPSPSTPSPSTPVTTEYYDYYSGLSSGDYENYTSGAGSGDSTFLRENMTTSGNSGNYDYFTPSIHRSTVVECAVGVEIQSSLYQTSQRRNVICPPGSSGQPGCMQMNVDGAYMGFKMKFGYGMCVDDVSFCPTFDCRTMFDGVLANLSIPMNFDINKCDVSCLANQSSERKISTPTPSTPVTTEDNLIQQPTVVECTVGSEIQSSLYQTSDRRNVICPSASSGQPGCIQMNVDGSLMGFQMKFGYGMCVDDVSFCPTFDCRTMFDGVLANLSIPMNFDINKCDVSCLANQRSEGNISTPTHSTPSASTPSPSTPVTTEYYGTEPSMTVECAVGFEIWSSLFQENHRNNEICKPGSSGRPGCMQMVVDSSFSGLEMKLGYGVCIPDVSLCPTYDCNTLFNEFVEKFSFPEVYVTEINKCEISCAANRALFGGSSIIPSPVPSETTTGIQLGAGVECAVGLKANGSFEVSQQTIVTCPHLRAGQPACVQMQIDGSVMKVDMNIEYGMCVSDDSMCPTFNCNSLIDGLRHGVSFLGGLNLEVNACGLSCCSSGSNCFSSETLNSSSPLISTNQLDQLGRNAFVTKEELAVFPSCTMTEYFDDVLLCATLFLNDYPYAKNHECSENGRLFVNCANKKTKTCFSGSNPTLFYYAEHISNTNRFLEQIRQTITFHLQKMTDSLCSAKGRNNLVEIITHYTKLIVDGGDRNSFSTARNLTENFKHHLINLLQAKSSEEFCKFFTTGTTSFSQLYSEFRTNVYPDLIRSKLDPLPQEIYDQVFQRVTDLIEEVQLPKCTAYEEKAQETTARKLEILFIVQGSGYENSAEFNETLSLISRVVEPLNFDRITLGLMLYSKYLRNRSMKNQPFITTEIECDYFNTHTEFQEALANVESHNFNGSEAYIGRAIKKSLMFDFKDSLKNNQTSKIMFIVSRNSASDKGTLRKMSNLIQRHDDLLVYAIGSGNSQQSELEMLAYDNGLNKLIMTDAISSLDGGDVHRLSSSLISLLNG